MLNLVAYLFFLVVVGLLPARCAEMSEMHSFREVMKKFNYPPVECGFS